MNCVHGVAVGKPCRICRNETDLSDEVEDLLFSLELWKQDATRLEMQRDALLRYARHSVDGEPMCEYLKHSDYPCTCGLDALRKSIAMPAGEA